MVCVLLGLCSHRRGTTTSLQSSANCTGWRQSERIDFRLALLAYKCQHGAAPLYLADELRQLADLEGRHCLCFASSPSLTVHRTRLSTVDDWAFHVTAARVCNSLSQRVTSTLSMSLSQPSEDTSLYALLSLIAGAIVTVMPEKWQSLLDTLIILVTCLVTTAAVGVSSLGISCTMSSMLLHDYCSLWETSVKIPVLD